jgi:alpha-tubulin suppressor-like RCC1 family protein
MTTKQNLIQICLLCAAVLPAITGGAQPVTQIAGGYEHSLFLKGDGSLWAMGGNQNGQLGDGTYNPTNRPEQIVASNVTAIAAGGHHSLFLKSDGSLWAMGDNQNGQLGDGTYNQTNRPEQIVASNVIAVATGEIHSLFIKNDGSLWAMGFNYYGQLGDGTSGFSDQTNRPEQIVASNVTAIAAGAGHSLFIKHDGSLWAMGDNEYGQLGDNSYILTNRPEQILASNVTAIAAGFWHSLFIKSDGSLWTMGYNPYGELGNGIYSTNAPYGISIPQDINSNVTAIAAGAWHSLFIKTNGSLWAMGHNFYGELGDGTYTTNFPFGTNRAEQVVASGVTAVAAGAWHSLFLKSDGSQWAMGTNGFGQLGDGSYSNTNLSEQIVAAYNQIFAQLLGSSNVRLSFEGVAGANYAVDRTFNLLTANWVPQMTNPAGQVGLLVLTNTADPTTNNFWRIRSVP